MTVGTILPFDRLTRALDAWAETRGKPLLIMPRRHALREHVNDHQLETVAKFGERPGIKVVMTPEEIPEALDAILAADNTAPPLSAYAEQSLIDAVRAAIFDTR